MSDKKKSVIIIKKVKKGHGGHHGGSWKVAYADFVTAMMAFFMVMWILGMDSDVRKAIEGYFTNPVGLQQGYSSGVSPIATGSSPSVVKTPQPLRLITRSFEEQKYRELANRIEVRLRSGDGLSEIAAQIEVVVTDQGLRIETEAIDKTHDTYEVVFEVTGPVRLHGPVVRTLAAQLAGASSVRPSQSSSLRQANTASSREATGNAQAANTASQTIATIHMGAL